MYFFIGFLLFLVLCTGLFIWRRRRARKKICCMSCREKRDLLDTILEPFGYCYVCDQDLISTRNDAWQRGRATRLSLIKRRCIFTWCLTRCLCTLITVAGPGS